VSALAESAAWGALVGGSLVAGALVAARVALPAPAAAAQPIVAAGRSPRFAVGLLTAIALALLGATVAGGTVLADVPDAVVGFLQALAAGAVLAVVLVSIVPHAFEQVSRWVAAAAAGGFVLGYLLG
jgi:ZIP family zinc transporter